MPEAFHARFPVSVKSYKVTMPKCLRPSAEQVSACGRRNEGPRRTQGYDAPRVRLSGHFSDDIWFGFLCAPVSCAMGIASEGSLEKIAILTLKARSHVRILIHIERGLF